jgi:hypothetical protein
MKDVTDALKTVFVKAGGGQGNGKIAAYAVLEKAGGGATNSKDLKPTLYAAVIKACAEWQPEPAGEGQPDFSQVETDANQAPDTSGAVAATPISAEDAIDSDPPEGVQGGGDADAL